MDRVLLQRHARLFVAHILRVHVELLGVEHLVEDLVIAGGREFEPLSDLDVLG